MSDELKKSIEKKRKIADLISISGLYALLIGVGILFIALFQVNAIEKFVNEDYMVDPSIPYNERNNASYIMTPDDFELIIDECTDFLIIGAVIAGIGIAVLACVCAIAPSKKERHKLVCPHVVSIAVDLKREKAFSSIEAEYCISCGLKLSLLDDKKHK